MSFGAADSSHFQNKDKESANRISYKQSRRGSVDETHKLVRYIDDNILGKNGVFHGPYGRRKVIFGDYVESGHSLHFIEDYILKEVLPNYGTILNSSNVTSLQSSLYRNEAVEIIRKSVNATSEDRVLFSGGTNVASKLISLLNISAPPVVFVSFSCHHSCIIPWTKIGAKVIEVSETKDGDIDLKELEEQLNRYQNCNRVLIGHFALASNLTGIMTDDLACTLLLHQYGALAIWDYTYAAPYIKIDMNSVPPGTHDKLFCKDAVIFSMHTFVGGTQTAGVIVVKKSLLAVPTLNTDGVSPETLTTNEKVDGHNEYEKSIIVEIIRTGLIMQLKNSVGISTIMQRLMKNTKQMLAYLRTIPEIILLGNGSSSSRKIPVFSFLIRHPRGTFLHHNFVCAILNDVFGIQARAGCKCAGPYAQKLLGINNRLAAQYEDFILEYLRLSQLNLNMANDLSMHELLRPGFCRISVSYFTSDQEIAFIMEALKMVATEGWKLLPQYKMNVETGEFRHYSNMLSKDRNRLNSIRYADGKMHMNERRISGPGTFPQNYSDCLKHARNLFNQARKMAQKTSLVDQGFGFDDRSDKVRWFMIPNEAQDLLRGNSQNVKHCVPFDPSYTSCKSKNKLTDTFSIDSVDSRSNSTEIRLNDQCKDDQSNKEVVATRSSTTLRERCYSLDSKQRKSTLVDSNSNCSTHLSSISKLLPTTRGKNLHECRSNTIPRSRKKDEKFQSYLNEMTKEIANELKSEIREVILKVEDVLELSDSNEASGSVHCNSKHGSDDDRRSDSMSIGDIANEITSESCDVFAMLPNSEDSITRSKPKYFRKSTLSECVGSDKSADSDETLFSISIDNYNSQDSGINSIHQDSSDSSMSPLNRFRNRCYSDLLVIDEIFCFDNKDDFIFNHILTQKKWHGPRKNIWKPFIQAVRDYNMIRDNDRILLPLSEDPNSIALLHILHQYQCYMSTKGLNFTFGVTLMDFKNGDRQLQVLGSYIKYLGVDCVQNEIYSKYSENSKYSLMCTECYKKKRNMLYDLAETNKYNVIALSQSLDDFIEHFFTYFFYRGQFQTKEAHSIINLENLRKIRPLIYVREKSLQKLAEMGNYPLDTSNKCPSCANIQKSNRSQIKKMVTQQETLIPDLFRNLRTALQSLTQLIEPNPF